MKNTFGFWNDFTDEENNIMENYQTAKDYAESICDAVDFASDILPDIGYMAIDAVGEMIANLFSN